jgi:hypothetical protein
MASRHEPPVAAPGMGSSYKPQSRRPIGRRNAPIERDPYSLTAAMLEVAEEES